MINYVPILSTEDGCIDSHLPIFSHSGQEHQLIGLLVGVQAAILTLEHFPLPKYIETY